jgi:hypothetical protein
MSTHKPVLTHHQDDEDAASPTFSRLMVIAFLVAVLLGVVTGSIWIAWNLLRVSLF